MRSCIRAEKTFGSAKAASGRGWFAQPEAASAKGRAKICATWHKLAAANCATWRNSGEAETGAHILRPTNCSSSGWVGLPPMGDNW
jgi:uncharacterized protein (DUF924 family)